ncbi:MAG: DUF5105 domain-containing protein [Clostridia bacterium]|nr:DUF5105 domain-containing protein [Clostridia bacterium]
MRVLNKTLLIVITLCFALSISLYGCGDKAPTPTETADTFLTAVKAQDTETIKTVYEGETLDMLSSLEDEESESEDSLMDDDYFGKILLPKMLDFDYELSNEKIDGDKATVDVKITTYDIGSAFSAFMSDYFAQALTLAFGGASDEQIEELANTIFESKMDELKEKTYSETVTLDLVKKDDVWKVAEIDEDSEFLNALSGNMIKTLDKLEEIYSFEE